MTVASAKLGSGGASWVRFSTEGEICPRSVTLEWRERDRERRTVAGARFRAESRWVGELGSVVLSSVGCTLDWEGP